MYSHIVNCEVLIVDLVELPKQLHVISISGQLIFFLTFFTIAIEKEKKTWQCLNPNIPVGFTWGCKLNSPPPPPTFLFNHICNSSEIVLLRFAVSGLQKGRSSLIYSYSWKKNIFVSTDFDFAKLVDLYVMHFTVFRVAW